MARKSKKSKPFANKPVEEPTELVVSTEAIVEEKEVEMPKSNDNQELLDEIARLKAQIAENDKVNTDLTKIKAEVNSMRKDLEKANKTIDKLNIVNNKLENENDELILKNSELSFENTRLEVINSTISTQVEETKQAKTNPVDIQTKKVYTMEHEKKPRNRNHKYISRNGYDSWN